MVEVAAVHRPFRLEWLPGERQRWADTPPRRTGSDEAWQHEIEAMRATPHNRVVEVLADAPEHLARPHLAWLPELPIHGRIPFWYQDEYGYMQARLDSHLRLLGRYGDEVVTFLAEGTPTHAWGSGSLWEPVVGTDVTWMMVDWLDDSQERISRNWFRRHAAAAARDLIPAAVGSVVKQRRAAERVLRMLDRSGHRAEVLAAAAEFGDEVYGVVIECLDGDPLLWLPTRVPKPPEWVRLAALPRIRLRDRALALPESAVAHLVSMLMMCRPDDDYAGVRAVAEVVDPASAGEFAWALFRAWQAARFPAKRNFWPLRALGLLGNDDTAARLRRLAETEKAINRAVEAVDMLVMIGTANACMQLQLLREASVSKMLRRKVERAIRDVCERQGSTEAEFADRAVPDLGLSAAGTMMVDYGTRRFVVGLDAQLRPVVRDEDGTPRATLPKPGKSDDPAVALAAHTAYGSFKKLLQSAVTDQSARLEAAMVRRRRWTAETHRQIFLDHPLLKQLAMRLVWVVFAPPGADLRPAVPAGMVAGGTAHEGSSFEDHAAASAPVESGLGDRAAVADGIAAERVAAAGGAAAESAAGGEVGEQIAPGAIGFGERVVGAFRVDADGTLADVHDELLTLPDDAIVGVAHPLDLGESLAAWSEVFADYQLLQPFSQLERAVFAPGCAEVEAGVERYRGMVVPTGRILRLVSHGWKKGYPSDGVIGFVSVPVGEGGSVQVRFRPGIEGRNPMSNPEQTVEAVTLADVDGLVALGPVVVSELLRDLESLR